MKKENTQTEFAKIEKLLKKLKKDMPKKGIDPVFVKKLQNKLKDQYHAAGGEGEEESILDKILQGLSSWSKMPVLGALGAGVAVFLLVIQFGPQASVEEIKRELNSPQYANQPAKKTISPTQSAQSEAIQNESDQANLNSQNTQNLSATPATVKESKNQPDTITITEKAPSTSSDRVSTPSLTKKIVKEYKDTESDDSEEVTNSLLFAPPEEGNNGGGSTTVNEDVAPAGLSLADTPTIDLQIEVFGTLNEQIEAIKSDLSNLPNLDGLEVNYFDTNSANIEILLAPDQIDGLTNQLRTRSVSRQITGENSLRSLESSNLNRIRVRITIMSTPSSTETETETTTETIRATDSDERISTPITPPSR